MFEYIKHPSITNSAKVMSLSWRKNPFTNQWEFWHHRNYWHTITNAASIPNLNLGDVVLKYKNTWCEPNSETENANT